MCGVWVVVVVVCWLNVHRQSPGRDTGRTVHHLINMKRLRRKILSVLWPEITKAHNENVQVHVRQLEHGADARFSQRQKNFSRDFLKEADQALEDQREKLVTEATSEVWRRDASNVHTTYVQN